MGNEVEYGLIVVLELLSELGKDNQAVQSLMKGNLRDDMGARTSAFYTLHTPFAATESRSSQRPLSHIPRNHPSQPCPQNTRKTITLTPHNALPKRRAAHRGSEKSGAGGGALMLVRATFHTETAFEALRVLRKGLLVCISETRSLQGS